MESAKRGKKYPAPKFEGSAIYGDRFGVGSTGGKRGKNRMGKGFSRGASFFTGKIGGSDYALGKVRFGVLKKS